MKLGSSSQTVVQCGLHTKGDLVMKIIVTVEAVVPKNHWSIKVISLEYTPNITSISFISTQVTFHHSFFLVGIIILPEGIEHK